MTSTEALERLHEVVRDRLPKGEGAARRRALRFLEEQVVESPQFGDIPYDRGSMWDEGMSRSRSRYVHGFLWLADWPALVRADPAAARRAYELSLDWYSRSRAWRSLDAHMAFHDETTAQRLTMHLGVIEAQSDWLTPAELDGLHGIVDKTADLLVRDDFHGGLNNHGMFQDIALVNWAGMASWAPRRKRAQYLDLALERLASYFSHAFTHEGVHIEHAPNYHLMVVRHLQAHLDVVRAVDDSRSGGLSELLAGTLAYATHAVGPDGLYPLVSDTTRQPLTGAARGLGDPSLLFAATGGKQGRAPVGRTHVVPASGYAIHRSAWGDSEATFIFFSCAYNGPFHKHADENSLLVQHRGLDLISEAGPNGYSYDDPLTRYGYSQFAHSTLVVDGQSVPRTGGPTSTVDMRVGREQDGFCVTGRNGRLRDGVEHERTVDVRDHPDAPTIDVTDVVRAPDPHRYDILWHVGADLEVVLHGQGYELHHQGQKVMDVTWEASTATRVSIRRGEGGSSPQGWRFPVMGRAEASDVVVVSFEGTDVELTTKVRLADFAYRDRQVSGRTGWRRWSGSEVGLNYLPVHGRRDRLVVAFTSMHQVGDFTSNYKPTVDAAGVEARFVLDDWGDQGCYYLQDHGDRAVFRSVQAFIRHELEELGLTPRDLLCIGSSKGATAALLHGLSLGAGEIFVGAPQTRIGSFLSKPHPNVLRFMTGRTDEQAIADLDRVLYDLATTTADTWADSKITVLVGDRDHHYRNHVLPFAAHVADLPGALDVVPLPGLTHADIGPAYRDALAARLRHLMADDPEDGDLTVRSVASARRVTALAFGGSGTEFAARLFRGADHVRSVPYSTSRSMTFGDVPPGRYRARVFARDEDGDIVDAKTSDWVNVT
ncbi:heparinase II/III family protein [Janibacter sp. UYMM211]|uniref:heparinase II/III domain-containing protein n=1 Tax=Janibacter sp. UYMM211 TaxID=3156342 RepID=UPI003396BCB9